MEIYLPIAEMSVHWLVILGMGAAVGFLSGMFGVGGSFLLTPLLMFYGVPPGVAVATTSGHITASSISGAITQWRKRMIDLKMGAVMIASGLAGSFAGVWLFGVLQHIGQTELTVSLGYVVLLGIMGGLMLNESVRTLIAERMGKPPPQARAKHHSWVHRLPLKMRFRTSRLYTSVIPPVVIGIFVGVLSSVMGVGGGFIIIPALIYLLRMPTSLVIGTSRIQIIFVTASSTIFHAVNDYTVDIVLTGLLVLGGTLGAQLGVHASSRLRGEQLRLLLALLVLAVAARLLYGLIVTPDDPFSVLMGSP